jgi:alcohol dehydrogenase YqhD (iron-dependent ADH family)
MENFIYCNPTTLHFGRNSLYGLRNVLQQYGSKVLLVYGKGSVKKSGLYDTVIDYLKEVHAEVVEYSRHPVKSVD